jgi:hypothetical protein
MSMPVADWDPVIGPSTAMSPGTGAGTVDGVVDEEDVHPATVRPTATVVARANTSEFGARISRGYWRKPGPRETVLIDSS